MAGFQKLPAEIRQEIWGLALLPEPGVYGYTRRDTWRMWQVQKTKYPAVMHVNRESRAVAMAVWQGERRAVGAGLPREYWFGLEKRPFMKEMDTFWFDDPVSLRDWAGTVEQSRGSGRRWSVKHLALSARCFDEVLDDQMQCGDEYDYYDYDYGSHNDYDAGPPIRSGWDAIKLCLRDLIELESISVLFGPIFPWSGHAAMRYDEGTEEYTNVTIWDIPDVRLEGWTSGSTEQKQAQVDGLLARVRMDMASIIEAYNQEREAWEKYVGYGMGAPMGHNNASSPSPRRHVKVQAKRMVKIGEFRGRSG